MSSTLIVSTFATETGPETSSTVRAAPPAGPVEPAGPVTPCGPVVPPPPPPVAMETLLPPSSVRVVSDTLISVTP